MKRLTDPFHQFGPISGVLYIVDRALQRMHPRCRLHSYELMAQPISDRPLLSAALEKSYEFREICRGQAEVEVMPALQAIKESRFDQGARCLGAYKNGELIGYIWFAFSRYEEDEVRCTYELPHFGRSAFDFDLYILPKHRMGPGFAAIWHGANSFLKRQGVVLSYSRMTRFNLASRRAHERLGAKRVARAVFLQLGPVECMVSTCLPFFHASISPSNRVKLWLKARR